MANIGTSVAYGGEIPAEALAALGITCVRVVAKADADDSDYFGQLQDHGLRIWLVLARESFEGIGSLGPDEPPTPEVLAEGFGEYARRYGDRIAVWVAGNEPDITSPASWTQSPEEFGGLLGLARECLGTERYLVAGGLAGGNPEWLSGVEALDPPGLDWVNGIAVHPYGQVPDARFDFDPPWYFGRVPDLLAGFRSWLDAAGRTDKALHVSEWGAPLRDFEDAGVRSLTGAAGGARRRFGNVGEYLRVTRERIAGGRARGRRARGFAGSSEVALERHGHYIARMAQTLRESELVGDAIQFCYTNRMVSEFGLTDESLEPLPAWHELRSVL